MAIIFLVYQVTIVTLLAFKLYQLAVAMSSSEEKAPDQVEKAKEAIRILSSTIQVTGSCSDVNPERETLTMVC